MRAALLLCLVALEVSAQGRLYDRTCAVSSRRSSRGGVGCATAPLSIGNAVTADDKVGNWWQLNVDGTTEAGSALTMVAAGSPTVSPLTFNGTSQYYSSSATAAFPAGDFGFVTVYKPTAEAGEVVNKWDGTTLVFTVELVAGVTRFYVQSATGATIPALGAGSGTGSWVCVGGRYTASSGAIVVRVAGANASATATGAGIKASTQKHGVAAKTNGAGFFAGTSRGVFWTETPLSDAAIDRICAGAM